MKVTADGSTEEIYSSDIFVGDILYIPEDQMFCADVVLFESSNEGTCFIQTSSLDGEKNLKKRMKPKDFAVTPGLEHVVASKTLGSKNDTLKFKAGKLPSF